jgi:hypothetical protein
LFSLLDRFASEEELVAQRLTPNARFMRSISMEQVEERWVQARRALTLDYKQKHKTATKRQKVTHPHSQSHSSSASVSQSLLTED